MNVIAFATMGSAAPLQFHLVRSHTKMIFFNHRSNRTSSVVFHSQFWFFNTTNFLIYELFASVATCSVFKTEGKMVFAKRHKTNIKIEMIISSLFEWKSASIDGSRTQKNIQKNHKPINASNQVEFPFYHRCVALLYRRLSIKYALHV